MKIKISFYYNQEFLPTKRHRNIRTRELKKEIEVQPTELTEAEFPLAFIVHDYATVVEGMKSYEDYDTCESSYRVFPEEIRTYKGKLYKPARITHGAAISTLFEGEDYVKRSLERYYTRKWYDNEGEFSEKSIVVRDDLKSRKRQLTKIGKNYLHFDNKFWYECSEPRYVINTFGLGHNHGGTGFFIEYHYNGNIPSDNYFNALQRDEAIRYGKEVALRRGDTESVEGMGDHDYIEVIMPEMVKCNPKKQHGKGNGFINTINTLIDNSESTSEAALLTVAFSMIGV